MRPIKLTMSAFGPYASKTVLEMDKLGERGLYLITGTTGAGKTSIFDAITYALYGKPSGEARDGSMLRSKYAEPSSETYVELEFLYNGKMYTVRRNPEYERPKTRGEGMTKQTERSELRLPDGRIIDKSKKEVTKAVEEIMGIDRSQFLQIAMIAQGDFLRLLLAKTDERKAIFRHIFKTQKFEMIQSRLKEETKKLNELYRETEDRIKLYSKNIACDSSEGPLELVEKARNRELGNEMILSLLAHLILEDEELREKLSFEIEKSSGELGLVNASIGKAEEYIRNLSELENKRADMKKASDKLEAAKRICAEENAKQEERDALDREIALKEAELERYDTLDLMQKELASIREKAKRNAGQLCELRVSMQKEQETLKKFKSRQKELENAGAEKARLEAEKERLNDRKLKLEALCTDIAEFFALCGELREKQEEYKLLSSEAEALSEAYNRMNRAFLDAQAGIIASTLTEGKPCPVCGSTNHPMPAEKSENAPTENELKKARKTADTSQKMAEKKSLECGKLDGRVRSAKESLKKQSESLLGEYEEDSLLIKAKDALKEAHSKLKEVSSALICENDKINEKKKLDGDIPAAEKNIELMREREGTYLSEISANEAFEESKKKQFAAIRAELACSDKKEALGVIQALKARAFAMKKALDTATRELNEIEKKLSVLKGEASSLEKVVSSVCEIDITAEKEKRARLTRENAARQNVKEAVISRLESNRRCLENIEEAAKKAETLESRLTWLNALSQTANGGIGGKERIMLETYVQMNFFDRILSYANIRLNKMTNGQYDLVRRKEAVDLRGQVGLELDVIDHHNGSIRPVHTLSGGESFKASLALALGLSDEIQSSAGGVRLDTMFVDEGFGSLDDESLRLAISTLSELTEGNKLVGIISHVGELKTKIDKQIIVSKETAGSSCTMVIE